jgi:hypothetical protein
LKKNVVLSLTDYHGAHQPLSARLPVSEKESARLDHKEASICHT